MIATASSTDIIGPPKAKAIVGQLRHGGASLGLADACRPAHLPRKIASLRIIAATAGISSRWATGSVVSTVASVAMPAIAGSSGNSGALPLAFRYTSILRLRLGLEAFDDHEIDPRHLPQQFGQPRLGGAAQFVHQRPIVCPKIPALPRPPDCRCTQESLPGTSTSKLWWACLMTETRSPSVRRCGMTRAQQRGLAGTAPSRQADHFHLFLRKPVSIAVIARSQRVARNARPMTGSATKRSSSWMHFWIASLRSQ